MIPLIIPNFNQLYYLINLVNWWNYYTNNSGVIIVDQNSTWRPLLDFYDNMPFDNVEVHRCDKNDMGLNLAKTLELVHNHSEYYFISNPDIQPHPNTPENFIDIFKHCIDELNFHRVGFALNTESVPAGWYGDAVRKWESKYTGHNYDFQYDGQLITGTKAPIDLTLAMYKSSDGWSLDIANTKNWFNGLRLFDAFHFGWYIDPETKIAEHQNYFETCRHWTDKELPTKGVNNWNPNRPVHER